MRDGSTRRRSTSPQSAAELIDLNQVHDWRRHGRLDDLRTLAEGANGLTLSRGLLRALLEELHISDDFDVLVGRVARLQHAATACGNSSAPTDRCAMATAASSTFPPSS